MIDFEELRKELILDEGYSYKVYKDSEGNNTIGIGHLIEPSDGMNEDTVIGEELIEQLYIIDIVQAEDDCEAIFNNWEMLPVTVQHVLLNMAFNMGRSRLSGFVNMIAAVHVANFRRAGMDMMDSKWHRELVIRPARLAYEMFNEGEVTVHGIFENKLTLV